MLDSSSSNGSRMAYHHHPVNGSRYPWSILTRGQAIYLGINAFLVAVCAACSHNNSLESLWKVMYMIWNNTQGKLYWNCALTLLFFEKHFSWQRGLNSIPWHYLSPKTSTANPSQSTSCCLTVSCSLKEDLQKHVSLLDDFLTSVMRSFFVLHLPREIWLNTPALFQPDFHLHTLNHQSSQYPYCLPVNRSTEVKG